MGLHTQQTLRIIPLFFSSLRPESRTFFFWSRQPPLLWYDVAPPPPKKMTPLGSALQSTPLSASQREGRAFKALWSLCWGVFCCLFVWLHKEKSDASRCTNAGLCTGCFVTHTHPSTHPRIPSWVFSLCRNVYSVHIICVAQPIHLFMCCRCEQRQHCFHCFIFYPFRILHLTVLAG